MMRFGSILLLAALAMGCQPARVSEPLTKTLGASDDDAQLEFWHQLETRPITCNDDAFHGLLLYLDQTDPSADYAARVNTLKSRKILAPEFNGAADAAVTRGTLAVAVVHILKIKGGILLHALPESPRYAVRELIYRDVFPPSTPNQTFSGAEYLGIIGRIEDFQRGDKVDIPASEMPQLPANSAPPD